MELSVKFTGRLCAAETKSPEGLVFTVQRMSFLSQGGCDMATVTVKGEWRAIADLLNCIGYGIEFYDEYGDWQWGGIINSVQTNRNKQTIGLTLEGMSNSVAITYQDGKDAATTDYSTDAASIAKYGFTKQRLENMSEPATASDAEGLRALRLSDHKLPMTMPVEISGAEEGATLECIGLFRTLEWTYITKSDTLEDNTDNTESGFDWMANRIRVGDWQRLYGVPMITSVAQKFTATNTCFVGQLCMYIGGVGPPPGQLTLELWSDGANPTAGTQLCTTALFSTGIADFVKVTPTSSPQVVAGTSYWIRASVAGISDNIGTPYIWVFGVDPALTGNSRFTDLDNGTWQNITTIAPLLGWSDFQFLFKIFGYQENSQQISDIITTVIAINPFFTGTDILNSSGFNSSPLISEAIQASERIKQLLDKGSTNVRRLLARTTQQRRLVVYEEPARDYDNTPLHMRGNTLVDILGNEVRSDPCGQWCVADEFEIPRGVEPNPAHFLVDGAEWNPLGWRVTARGVIDPIRSVRTIRNS